MKPINLSFFLLALTLLSPGAALASGGATGVGGGGKGVVCRGADRKILSAELLDLWEAKTIFGRTIEYSTDSVDAQVDRALTRMQNAIYIVYKSRKGDRAPPAEMFRAILKNSANPFLQNDASIVRLRGVKLIDTPDSEEAAVPADCNVEQIINFQDSQTTPKILVNQDIFEKLSNTDQAALIVHEALYSYLRTYGERTSVRTRRAVGYVFAGESFPEFDSLIFQKKHIRCVGADKNARTEIRFYKKEDGKISTNATFVDGIPSLGQLSSTADTDDLLDQAFQGDIEAVLSDKNCQTPTFASGYALDMFFPGMGPADFQRGGELRFQCLENKFTVKLTAVSWLGGSSGLSLSCQLIEPGNPNQ